MGDRLGPRARGACPRCGRVLAGAAVGPQPRAADRRWVRLPPHVTDPDARRPAWCLTRGTQLKVPRLLDPAPAGV